MAENKISTTVKDVSFDDILAEFDKPKDDQVLSTSKFIPDPNAENKVFDAPIKKEEPAPVVDDKDKPKVANEGTAIETKLEKVEIKDLDSVLDRKPEEEVEEEKKESSLISVLDELTKEDILIPFDMDKPISQYSHEDLKELIKENINHHKKEALETEIGEFFESLPAEIQYAAKYVADGGNDLKGLFKALAATEEIKSLDVKNVKDRESIIREYYRAIEWGNEDEVEEEVERVKELGESELEKLANKFKPKLEKMHEEVTQQQIGRQERAKKIQQEEMNFYLENAHEAIKAGKIDEIQLDKKTQSALWAGLTQPSYQTRRGAITNKLGHLLEKYQYTEPNFNLIYKVLWLLEDEKGFEDAVSKKTGNKVVSDTVRVLKTEQSKKTGNGIKDGEPDNTREKKKVLTRNVPNFMSGLKK